MKIAPDQLKVFLTVLCSQTGMALAETLVAIAILGISGAAFATSLSTGSIAVNNQKAISTAQALAQTQLETIQNSTYNSSYSAITTPANYGITLTVSTPPGGDADIQKISVGVSHNAAEIYLLQGYKVNR